MQREFPCTLVLGANAAVTAHVAGDMTGTRVADAAAAHAAAAHAAAAHAAAAHAAAAHAAAAAAAATRCSLYMKCREIVCQAHDGGR